MIFTYILEQLHTKFPVFEISRIILLSLAIICITWFINKLLKKACANFEQQHTINPKFAQSLRQLISFILYSLALILLLDNLHLEISNVLRTLSVIIFGLGFAAKQICTSIITGIFLLTYKSITINDYIICDDPNFQGKVLDINLHTTTLEYEGNIIKVPNQTIYNAVITIKKNVAKKP